ncbi:MAG: AAA family ATPase [Candidatus Krumholzibacteriota bacterium]|nr:AAA family ATPase [Candidatus Krumholzibacteriota bacterium]
MLTHLRIRDLVVVEEAVLELDCGLNVLSGVTGAGKSVLLAALTLVAGGRARTDWIRPSADRARVEAFFELDAGREARLREAGFDVEGGECQVTRELRPDGRGRALLDGFPLSVRRLRDLGALLLERQDQHGQLDLLAAESQRALLDRWAGHADLLGAYRADLAALRTRRAEEERLALELARVRRDEEYLRFQLDEIAALDPRPGEMEELGSRERRLRNAARIQETLAEGLRLLEGEGGLAPRLAELRRVLDRLDRLEAGLGAAPLDLLEEQMGELAGGLAERREAVAAEADEGERLAERLGRLHALERKHGVPLDEILDWAVAQRRLLEGLAEGERLLAERAAARRQGEKALAGSAAALSESRLAAAARLGAAWQKRLHELGMARSRLRVEVTPREEADGWIERNGLRFHAGEAGMDSVRVLVRPNPDLPEGELREVPSGGELSRISLALHLLGLGAETPPVLVLDEVDAGLGADTARALADPLRELAARRQVILVTHQAPLAAVARRHFLVRKEFTGQRTRTIVERLEGDARVAELARMLGEEASGGAGDARRLAASLLAPPAPGDAPARRAAAGGGRRAGPAGGRRRS